MEPQRWAKIESLYHAALAKDCGERSAYLAEACAQDPELRGEVESLLGCADAELVSPVAERNRWPAGFSLGVYEILAPLGAGGMGEVYRARDTKLKRDVALKVLPDAYARDPERMARFQREAEVLASLNHPNIAHIYGVEERALVMELVEGESPKGPLRFEDAWKIAMQIADALEYAHERGVIHRDLKPANVKVTPDGVVKLLDFGLAKAFSQTPESAAANPEKSPMLTLGATIAGTVLGTAAYMAPEQAKGKRVDKRADIWSWGVVLYELLAGERLFKGEDAADTLAQVLSKEPDLDRVPPQVGKLLPRCLEKDPKKRLRDIGEARYFLDEPTQQARVAAPLGWAVAASVLTLIAAGLGWTTWRATRPVEHPLVRLNVDLGEEIALPAPGIYTDVIISPDGTRIAYQASTLGGQPKLFTRRLDQPKATELLGTEGAVAPFFSPDGQWIGFSVPPGGLDKISVEGGAIVPLSNVPLPLGAAWGEDGAIIGNRGGAGSGLIRIPPGGGNAELLTDLTSAEIAHGLPQILPGGKAILFVSYVLNTPTVYGGSVEVLTLADRRRRVLVPGATGPHYLSTGHLIYLIGSTLFAVPFDLDRLETYGTAVPILDDVAYEDIKGRTGQFDISAAGTLIYRRSNGGSGTSRNVTLQWLDATGKRESLPAKAGNYLTPRLSPVGGQLAVTAAEAPNFDIRVYESQHDNWTRLTTDSEGFADPVWTPNGQYIVFAAQNGGIFWTRWDRPGLAQPLIKSKEVQEPTSFTPNGKRLAYYTQDRRIFTVPVEDDGKQLKAGPPEPISEDQSAVQPRFSPDGPFLAYSSNQSGKPEVYVREFPTGGIWQISDGGGQWPVWSSTSHELLYQSGNQIVAVSYTTTSDRFVKGKSRVWAKKLGGTQWDLAPDGKHLLVLVPVAPPEAPKADHEVVFLENFFDYLRRRAPVNK